MDSLRNGSWYLLLMAIAILVLAWNKASESTTGLTLAILLAAAALHSVLRGILVELRKMNEQDQGEEEPESSEDRDPEVQVRA